MINDTLMDAVARFTGADVDAFRREWNAQLPDDEPSEKQDGLSDDANAKLLQGGISARVLIKYVDTTKKAVEREVVLRRAIKSKSDVFIDVFCLDIQAPRLIKLQDIIQIVDIKTKTFYADPVRFLDGVLGLDILPKNAEKKPQYVATNTQPSSLLQGELKTAINLTRYEITALLFFAGVDEERHPAELKTIVEYVHSRCPNLTFKDSDLLNYLNMIYPDNQSFYYALERILGQETWIVRMFVEKLMALIKADGKVDEREKLFLADFLRVLEEEGFQLNFDAMTV